MRTFYWHEKKNLDLSRFFLLIGVTRLELAGSCVKHLDVRGYI